MCLFVCINVDLCINVRAVVVAYDDVSNSFAIFQLFEVYVHSIINA